MISAVHMSSHRHATAAARRRGRWGAAALSLILGALAPAAAIAAEQRYPLPRVGALPLAGGWIFAGACALLALILAIHALAALPPRPYGGVTWRLASLGLTLGGLGTLVWVGLGLYVAYFLLFIPTLLVAVG